MTREWDYTFVDADSADEEARQHVRLLEFRLRGWYVERLALFEDEPSALRFASSLGLDEDSQEPAGDDERIGYTGPSCVDGSGFDLLRAEYEKLSLPYAVYVAKRLPQAVWV